VSVSNAFSWLNDRQGVGTIHDLETIVLLAPAFPRFNVRPSVNLQIMIKTSAGMNNGSG